MIFARCDGTGDGKMDLLEFLDLLDGAPLQGKKLARIK
jgi:hypothetical protein